MGAQFFQGSAETREHGDRELITEVTHSGVPGQRPWSWGEAPEAESFQSVNQSIIYLF